MFLYNNNGYLLCTLSINVPFILTLKAGRVTSAYLPSSAFETVFENFENMVRAKIKINVNSIFFIVNPLISI